MMPQERDTESRRAGKLQLLIADDDPDTRAFLKTVFEKRAYKVCLADNGLDALTKAQKDPPDFIISDTLMPQMDGFDLCRSVKKDERLCNIPFVFYTANFVDSESERLATALGASGFIAKSTNRMDLLERIDHVISDYLTEQLRVPTGPSQRDEELVELHAAVLVKKLAEKVRELDTERAALSRSEERFKDFAETAADWFWELDARLVFTHLTGRYEAVTGRPAESAIGSKLHRVLLELGISRETWELRQHDLKIGRAFDDLELDCVHPNGSARIIRLSGKPLYSDTGEFLGYRGSGRDVTEARELTGKLAYQAKHDVLTGLVNRGEFEARLHHLILTARAGPAHHALCYLDLDQFKVVNDTCGHAAGDELLRQLSTSLQNEVRKSDTLARLGGDEFGVLFENCSLEHAQRVTAALHKCVEEFRFLWEERDFRIGVSIGLVPITAASQSVRKVLSAADSACYAAKEKGRNRVHVFMEDDDELTRRHGEMQWVAHINRALEKDRFQLHFQTIMPINEKDQSGAHYELLIRMLDEQGAVVPPGIFLPAAERYNLATKIDRWVISCALAMLARAPAHVAQLDLCAINLSGQTVADETFLEFMVEEFRNSGMSPEKICFEITETAAISDLGNAIRLIDGLRDLGCRFALDDFGSGLSSFAYLKSLPVDFLKIDGMFVKDIVDDPIDFAMVKSINEIGHVMNKKTIAEFVENDAILKILGALGVDYAQGYGIARPELLELGNEAESPAG